MAGYELDIRVKSAFRSDAKDFLEFLKRVGRKYPVRFSYRSMPRGRLHLAFEVKSVGRLDALLQELILNRGLYYYFLAIRSREKAKLLNGAILPIFRVLVESYFPLPYSRFLRRHVLGKLSQASFVPGELTEPSAHEYELLFRRWDIGIIDDWNFVKDADSLLTSFLLGQVGHTPGTKSPRFPALLGQAYSRGIGMERETRKRIEKIHEARAGGLHRLQRSLSHDQVREVANGLYNYFQYFNDFCPSQLVKTVHVHRKVYRRVRYGEEKWPWGGKLDFDWNEITTRPCHDCFALRGQFHCEGCDVEQCPKCFGQLLGHGSVDIWD
ncbi:MAG TPA: hypothetical protein VN310_00555 [Candidatus Dormibacteraeota bacterium]|jgi:hypothetical protein|nr:hypothetical protein [Candidatus Dormibacteraeota bacterium]